jgi:predicted nucleic acid-binding protein
LSSWIVDASVAAKWVLPSLDEPYAAEAVSLLDQYTRGETELFVPDLFWPELGNLLSTACGRGRITEAQARQGLESTLAFDFPSTPTASLVADAFTIARAYGGSVYDAVYVALSMSTNRPLVTADERLANSLAAHFPVRWLGAL